MTRKFALAFVLLIPLADSIAQTLQAPIVPFYDELNLRLPVTPVDLQIVLRAKQILNRPEKWDQSDTRFCRVKACTNGCPTFATTFSLYCALERATEEVTGFEHRGAVMQEARFLIDFRLCRNVKPQNADWAHHYLHTYVLPFTFCEKNRGFEAYTHHSYPFLK